MRYVLGFAAVAVVLASLACGTEPSAAPHTNNYRTTFALTQIEADVGKGAIVVNPVDTNPDPADTSCTVNSFSYNNCIVDRADLPEIHVQSDLCEMKFDGHQASPRIFTECRRADPDFVRPELIPHCPGHAAL